MTHTVDAHRTAPLLSAIITTFDRSGPLRRVLEGLCRQTLERSRFEVVIVDDGSSDDTRQAIEDFAGRLPLRVSRQRHAGHASARNHGIYLARGAITLFLDEVARPAADLLARHLTRHREDPAPNHAYLGRTVLDPTLAADPLAAYLFGDGRAPVDGAVARREVTHRDVGGGSWSCGRAFLTEHGVYDPGLRSGVELVELAYRLSTHGLRFFAEPEARADLLVTPDLVGAGAVAEERGRGRQRFYQLHPAHARAEWGDREAVAREWREVEANVDRLGRAARELDRIARARIAAGLPVGEFETALLHSAYASFLRAQELRGFAAGAGAPAVSPRSRAAREAAPRVSIVVPVFNKVELTRQCFAALAGTTPRDLYEVLVVDNASTDGTREFLGSLSRPDRAIVNEENRGFVGACNQGIEASRGEWVLFLNNDTEPRQGWLEALLRTADADPRVGAVGARLVYPDGTLQEAGGLIFRDGSGWNFGRGDGAPFGPPFDATCEVDYCSGAALMVRRDVLARLGGFDVRYAPAYYEDTDLCFGIRSLGLKVMYCADSTVVHHEGATAGTDVGSGFKRFQVVNHAKFIEKWRDALERQDPPPTDTGKRPTTADRRRLERASGGAGVGP